MSSFRIWKQGQLFEPGRMGLFFNPFYFARKGLLDGLKEFFPMLHGRVLDVGCGRKPYRHLVPAEEYIGLEIDTPGSHELGSADLYYTGGPFPVPDASFDVVICSQVLEHVFSPDEFIREIHRVLRPGGKLLLATPFVWDEHEQPHDFGRYSSFGLRVLIERGGLKVEQQRKTCADFRTIVQLASGALYKITRTKHRWLNAFVQLALLAPVNMLGGLGALVLPRNQDLYLDNIVLARKQ